MLRLRPQPLTEPEGPVPLTGQAADQLLVLLLEELNPLRLLSQPGRGHVQKLIAGHLHELPQAACDVRMPLHRDIQPRRLPFGPRLLGPPPPGESAAAALGAVPLGGLGGGGVRRRAPGWPQTPALRRLGACGVERLVDGLELRLDRTEGLGMHGLRRGLCGGRPPLWPLVHWVMDDRQGGGRGAAPRTDGGALGGPGATGGLRPLRLVREALSKAGRAEEA
mmetsp:Transcript_152565/g.266407  ORF Transcript_152565/g.266407 Transcript_152565/m.266407 type:complete len:222 (+) Transcript_152565:481-1146(+)